MLISYQFVFVCMLDFISWLNRQLCVVRQSKIRIRRSLDMSSIGLWTERMSARATAEGMERVHEFAREWYCSFCEKKVDLWHIEDHIRSKKHVNNKDWHESIADYNRMKEQGMVAPWLILHDGEFWCAICDKKADDNHLSRPRHQEAVRKFGETPIQWYYNRRPGKAVGILPVSDIPPPPKTPPPPRLAIEASKQPPPPPGPPSSALTQFGLLREQPPPPPGSPPAALQPNSFSKSGASGSVMLVEETVIARVYRYSDSSEMMLLPPPGLHPPALPPPSPPSNQSGYELTQPPQPLSSQPRAIQPPPPRPAPLLPSAFAPSPVHATEFFDIADEEPAPWQPPPLPLSASAPWPGH